MDELINTSTLEQPTQPQPETKISKKRKLQRIAVAILLVAAIVTCLFAFVFKSSSDYYIVYRKSDSVYLYRTDTKKSVKLLEQN